MKTYLFDFDGTLVDSMPDWSKKVLRVLEVAGVTPPADILKTLTPLGDTGSMRYFRQELGVTLTEAQMQTIMDDYALPAYRDRIAAKPFVIETLHRLKAQGHSLNVLTASPHQMLDPCLHRLGLFDLFDRVWSCEDFAMTKVQPQIYHAAAREMGVSVGECLFLDDNIHALRAAKEAGMQVIGVYDDCSLDFIEEMKQLCHRYIDTFAQL